MSKSQAIHSNIISFFARYAQYLYNMSEYIGEKTALELGENGLSSENAGRQQISDKAEGKGKVAVHLSAENSKG